MDVAPSTDELLRLDNQICFALHAASRAFDALYRRTLVDVGLTYPQYLVMLVLWEHGELSVKEVGERLRLDSGTLSPLLKRLETAGLVVRERSKRDERSVTVCTTEAGRALREDICPLPSRITEATGMSLSELKRLRGTLRELTDALDAATESASR